MTVANPSERVITMKDLKGTIKFTVPEDAKVRGTQDAHPEAGSKKDVPFDYVECENDSEAIDYINSKKWNLVDIVNAKILSLARSSEYQNQMALYKPSEVSPEDIRDRMYRDAIRLGATEEQARALVANLTVQQ